MLKLAALLVTTLSLSAPHAFADGHENAYVFTKTSEKKATATISKAEMQKMMEKAFDKVDTEKKGKINQKQFELFMAELTRMSGG
jgi:DNA uptake protein ComE-like DNA-binding protein